MLDLVQFQVPFGLGKVWLVEPLEERRDGGATRPLRDGVGAQVVLEAVLCCKIGELV